MESELRHLYRIAGLNAPDGAGCFPTIEKLWGDLLWSFVSMHLMVLGASRLQGGIPTVPCDRVSMHLMVLGASRHYPREECARSA